ncbi:hypothetical protein MPTK1_1g24630 [Marchantia polymorpha subsp. ruderalis]|uniref:Uncharacterized protein n=2 Tax=Marchantia polymorpha TaxID=3197 RepID=A0AAF6ATW3_MARPO|nr:hypothetical protein MARPO_0061s0058 [Marchantia polymorpha]BBM99883.1 hypothetical protein Mp_1g24630 [Marchantia polymorpha subsp. ruderalis]|eukprot:PTQ36801.1 hypothetical protein MARPO_0061s0058 [Marchantia polymorpha]
MAVSVIPSPQRWLQLSAENFVGRPAGLRAGIPTRALGNSRGGSWCTGGGSRRFPGGAEVNRRRTRLACSPGDGKQEVASSDVGKEKEIVKPTVQESKGVVEKIEEEMGRQFGGVLWFTVLIVCLAVFGGAYVYYIFTFANFDDIPILRGPVR